MDVKYIKFISWGMEETVSLRGIWTSFRNYWSVRTPSSSELNSMIKEEKICSG